LYNEFFVALAAKLFHGAGLRSSATVPDVGDIRTMEVIFIVGGAAFVTFALMFMRVGSVERFFRNPWIEKIVLATMIVIVPITALELMLRPFAPALSKNTSLFVRDNDLGWRMRPNAEVQWGDVTVRSNGKGLRGPELDYQKPPGVFRILYLGDSVTFGFLLEKYEYTFPFLVETLLESSTDREIETVNAGVGGYSPWQEHVYLVKEGIHYQPDLVVVSFVLNDVTEKFQLVRFGGSDESYQLTQSYYSRLDYLLARSGLAYQVRNFARKLKARRKLGADLQLGAIKQQALNVETLMKNPEQENVKISWRITLQNLQRIVDFCRQRDVPLLLVIFPFKVQLEDPTGLSAPQRTLTDYAADNGIPFIDLLPVYSARVTNVGHSPDRIFIDYDHPTPLGSRIAADAIARRIQESGWLR
jgi:lysophospholipase L1-like esterase